jgi:uncharacterized LabA/DUF88 family protein
LAHQERVNIAVFIDFDNIEIGVKTTLGEHFDIGVILEALKERGEVVTKIAYADWTRAGEYSRALTQHAIRLVQRNLTPGGDKNGADINLALDALEMAFTHPHINAYVIVGGDSDFLSLVEKLKQYDKKVFVVGGRAFTSIILQRNCHEFIAYENLVRKPAVRGGRPAAPSASAPMAQAFPIVRRALKILADREVSPQTGLLKSTLLQLDSTFSERSYGASSFLDFTEKLEQAGLVQLKHSGRSVMVELNPAFPSEDADAGALPKPRSFDESGAADTSAQSDPPAPDRPLPAPATANQQPPVQHAYQAPQGQHPPLEMPSQLGDNAEGVKVAAQVLSNATGARWPMYLRNVKQILRADSYDERRYGFAGLIELLRACQRDGLVRLERDRRGGLRVFQGPGLARGAAAPPRVEPAETAAPYLPGDENEQSDENEDQNDGQNVVMADAHRVVIVQSELYEPDVIDSEPVMVVDTTAELLGRAKPKRPRARAGASPHQTGHTAARTATRKPAPAAKKPAATRRARPRKPSGNNGSD